MSEKVQTVQIGLSINRILKGFKDKLMLKLLDILEICYIIQSLNSYNSLKNKVAK